MSEINDNILENDHPKKILICRLSAIGDVIHTLPVAHALRKKFPEAELHWLVEKKAYQLVKMNPYIDQVILHPRHAWKDELKKRGFFAAFKAARFFFRSLKENNYDVFLDLHGLFKSAFTGYLAKAAVRIGPADGRELSPNFYHGKIEMPEVKLHQVERSLHLASALGAESESMDYGLKSNQDLINAIDKLLKEYNIDQTAGFIVINPFTTWNSKNWFEKRYRELAAKLLEKGQQVIFTGGSGDEAGIEKIIGPLQGKVYNFAGLTNLPELAELYKRAELFIGGDTGPAHLAAAVNLRVLCLMGPTDPATHGPYGKKHRVIQDNSLSCIRCWDKKCDRELSCMKAITVEQVYRTTIDMLESDNKDEDNE